MFRKPRSDAKLKNQPAELQEQIVDWCYTPETENGIGGLDYARQQLAAQGIQVSRSTVSEFHRWYRMCRTFEEAHDAGKMQEEWMRGFDPAHANNARAWGEYVFLQKALGSEDAKLFKLAAEVTDDRRLRELKEQLEPRKVAIAERQVAVQEKRFAEGWETLQSTTLTAEEKTAKLREIFGVGQ